MPETISGIDAKNAQATKLGDEIADKLVEIIDHYLQLLTLYDQLEALALKIDLANLPGRMTLEVLGALLTNLMGSKSTIDIVLKMLALNSLAKIVVEEAKLEELSDRISALVKTTD